MNPFLYLAILPWLTVFNKLRGKKEYVREPTARFLELALAAASGGFQIIVMLIAYIIWGHL